MPSCFIGQVSPSGVLGKRQRPMPSSSVSPVKIASACPSPLPAAPFARSPGPPAGRCGTGRIVRASRRRRCRAAHSRALGATSRITGRRSAGRAPSRRARMRGAGFRIQTGRPALFRGVAVWIPVGPLRRRAAAAPVRSCLLRAGGCRGVCREKTSSRSISGAGGRFWHRVTGCANKMVQLANV